VCAEPYYRGDGSGEILGYGLNTIRFLPRLSPPWISDFSVATLIQSLQEEGIARYLAFGLSPFSEVVPHAGDLPWLRLAKQVAWHANVESVYPVQALARKKAHHCAGQAVRLEDRFISADPAFAFPDTVRFLTLLFGENLSKLPEGVAIVAWTLIAKGLSRGARFVRSTVSGLRGIFGGKAVSRSSSCGAATKRRVEMKKAVTVDAAKLGKSEKSAESPMIPVGRLKQRTVQLWRLASDLW